MKIAFVNQCFDTIVPPFQNSVGYYTYGVARYLAKSSEVFLYGSKDVNPETVSQICDSNLSLYLVPTARLDGLLHKARRVVGELVQISSPMSTSGWLTPHYGRWVAENLRRRDCDVIHIQHCSQYVPIIRKLNPRAKIVLHIHAEWFSQSNFDTLQRRLDNVDLLLTVSDHITRKTKRDFPSVASRCETMYYGIDPEEFGHEKDYLPSRQRKEKRILFSGAVSPQKGPHVLLDAFAIIANQYPDVRLDIVGGMSNYPLEESFDLEDKSILKQVAPFYAKHPLSRIKAKLRMGAADADTYQSYLKNKLPGRIAGKVNFPGFIGHRRDLVDRYYGSDVFVFPPIWEEGFGIPPIEAMAAGVPVVGSHSGALPETVIDGETGFLVDKNDPRALARQILRLLKDDDLRETMGRAGRRRVLGTFAWERISSCLEKRYRQLLSGEQLGSSVN